MSLVCAFMMTSLNKGGHVDADGQVLDDPLEQRPPGVLLVLRGVRLRRVRPQRRGHLRELISRGETPTSRPAGPRLASNAARVGLAAGRADLGSSITSSSFVACRARRRRFRSVFDVLRATR
jgi:hypothetical protein